MQPPIAPAAAGIKRTIRRPEVLKKTGLSRTSIYMMERAGQFPRSFLLTPRCAVWVEEEIEAWLAKRRAQCLEQATSRSLPWPPTRSAT